MTSGNQDRISVSLLPGAADCILQQCSIYLNMPMNNTISVVALIVCMVMLNQVLGLPSAFSILKQILLAVHSYSLESFRRRWGFSMCISVLGLAIVIVNLIWKHGKNSFKILWWVRLKISLRQNDAILVQFSKAVLIYLHEEATLGALWLRRNWHHWR